MPKLTFVRVKQANGDPRFINPNVIVQIFQTQSDKSSNASTVELMNGSQIKLMGDPEDLADAFSASDDSHLTMSPAKK